MITAGFTENKEGKGLDTGFPKLFYFPRGPVHCRTSSLRPKKFLQAVFLDNNYLIRIFIFIGNNI